MGKGVIVGGGENGQYQVRLDLDTDRAESRLATLDAAIQQASLTLIDSEAALAAAESALETAIDALNTAIHALSTAEDKAAAQTAINAAGKTATEKAGERDKAKLTRDRDKLKQASLLLERETLAGQTPDDPVLSAWCADLSEDLTGTVGTIEIPGQRNSTPVIIRPGFEGAATYSAARDGALQPAISSTPAGAVYNLAMLPGWQKWKPTYRLGTITSREGDTCSVALDIAISSAQSLNVNQTTTLSGVSIHYMDCDGSAFEIDDRVIVEFEGQDWTKPQVIGFESEPRPCACHGLYAHIPDDALPWRVLEYKAGGWIAKSRIRMTPHPPSDRSTVDWQSDNPDYPPLIYVGPPTRYFLVQELNSSISYYETYERINTVGYFTYASIYTCKGRLAFTPQDVLGAGISSADDGGVYLSIISTTQAVYQIYRPSIQELLRGGMDRFDWQSKGRINFPPEITDYKYILSRWKFSQDGKKAVACFRQTTQLIGYRKFWAVEVDIETLNAVIVRESVNYNPVGGYAPIGLYPPGSWSPSTDQGSGGGPDFTQYADAPFAADYKNNELVFMLAKSRYYRRYIPGGTNYIFEEKTLSVKMGNDSFGFTAPIVLFNQYHEPGPAANTDASKIIYADLRHDVLITIRATAATVSEIAQSAIVQVRRGNQIIHEQPCSFRGKHEWRVSAISESYIDIPMITNYQPGVVNDRFAAVNSDGRILLSGIPLDSTPVNWIDGGNLSTLIPTANEGYWPVGYF